MSTTSAVFQLSKLGCCHVDSIVHLHMPILLPRFGVVFAFGGEIVLLVRWFGRPWSSISSTAIATTGAKQTQRERVLLPNMKQNPAEDENNKSLGTGSNMVLVRPNWRIDVDMSMDGTHNGDDNITNPVTGTHVRTKNAVLLDDAIPMYGSMNVLRREKDLTGDLVATNTGVSVQDRVCQLILGTTRDEYHEYLDRYLPIP